MFIGATRASNQCGRGDRCDARRAEPRRVSRRERAWGPGRPPWPVRPTRRCP